MGALAVTAYALDFSNPALETLHAQLLAGGTVANPALDRPLPSIDYRTLRTRMRGTSDLKVQSEELFQVLAEKNEDGGNSCFYKSGHFSICIF